METQNQLGDNQLALKKFNYWLIIAAFLIVTNIVSVAYLLFNEKKPPILDQTKVVSLSVDSDNDGLVDDEEKNYKTNPYNADTDGDGFGDNEEVKNGHDPLVAIKLLAETASSSKAQEQIFRENELLVAWNKEPKLISDYEKVLDKKSIKFDTDSGQYLALYLIGTVRSGQFEDSPLYLLQFITMGPSLNNANFYFVQKDKQNILITIYSAKLAEALPLKNIFSDLEDYYLSDLKIPTNIKIIDGIELKLINYNGYFNLMSTYQANDNKNLNIGAISLNKINTGSNLFLSKPYNRIVARQVDGTAREYGWDLNFFPVSRDDSKGYFDMGATAVLQAKWNNGNVNGDKYKMVLPMGCGMSYNYPDYIDSGNQLEVVGELTNGESLYELKDKTLKAKDSKVSILRDMYDQYYPGFDEKTNKEKSKLPYEQFLASHPLVYWQDPFGNYIAFTNDSFYPAVECGKPVIYLYPEKKTDINVQVAPNGGFSFTDPVYNQGGWQVSADSESNIYNYDDKKTYPYLFWEGYGIHYDRPKDGFVVKRAEIKKFLEEKLAYQGLIKKEYDEFIEYWLPRMQAQPYYFITFVPQAQFDQIAPLNIQPKPDTVIRVFMDYEGLSEYKTVFEQKLRKGVRRGYTVIEWGGAKR